jgi:hypothetical protein
VLLAAIVNYYFASTSSTMSFNNLESFLGFVILELGANQLWAFLFGLGLALTVCWDERLVASTLACIIFFPFLSLSSSSLVKR